MFLHKEYLQVYWELEAFQFSSDAVSGQVGVDRWMGCSRGEQEGLEGWVMIMVTIGRRGVETCKPCS